MGFVTALWIHMRQLLTLRHDGQNLPERWSAVVAVILVLAIISSQLHFLSIPESDKRQVEQVVAQQMGQPPEMQSSTGASGLDNAGVLEQAKTDGQETVTPTTPMRAMGVLIGQVFSFIIIGLLGGIGLLCAFALIELPLDLLRTVLLQLQIPFVGLIFFWEWIAIGVITWKFIKKKHPRLKK